MEGTFLGPARVVPQEREGTCVKGAITKQRLGLWMVICCSTVHMRPKLRSRQKRELVWAKQSEISPFMKHAAVQAATRSGVHPTAHMRMRWVITRKPDSSLEARKVVLGVTDPQLGAKHIADSVTTWSTTLVDRGRITENASVPSRCKDGLF